MPLSSEMRRLVGTNTLSVAVAGSSDLAILALQHWCNAVLDVDRLWKHLTAIDIHGELPGEAMIEAK